MHLTGKSCLLSSLALLGALPAFAGDIKASSHIDAVTLFPDAAQATRVAEVDLPAGASRVILANLPLGADSSTFQVSGEGDFAIGAIETEIETPAALDQTFNEPAIRKLQDEAAALDATLDVLNTRESMAKAYGGAQLDVWAKNEKSVDPEFQKRVWQLVSETLAKSGEQKRGVESRKREIEEQIEKLRRDEAAVSQAQPTKRVTVALEAKAATHARLSLIYRLGGSSWTPAYEARLDTGGGKARPKLELARRVFVKQSTGEDWTDVAMTISTLRAAGGTTPPVLLPATASLAPPPGAQAFRAPDARHDVMSPASSILGGAPRAGAPERSNGAESAALQIEAEQEADAYQAMFHAPGRFSLASGGAQKALQLSTQTGEARLVEKSAPSLDPRAFLVAHFTNSEGAKMAPGPVQLYRDGVFIGQAVLPGVAPGDSADLGFGADDRVSVAYAPVRRQEDKAGLFGGVKTDTREFKTVLRNLHDFPVQVEISDRMPYSETADISVELLPQSAPPTEQDPNGKRGLLVWRFELPPQQNKEIDFGYRIKWPSESEIILRQPVARRLDPGDATQQFSFSGGARF